MRRFWFAILAPLLALSASAETITTSGPGPTIFDVTSYGALCNGTTDDTTAIQNAVTAWKTTAVYPGTSVLRGPGRMQKCKVTAPLDFTNAQGSASFASIVKDLYLYGVFNYAGPIGTLTITNAGNYTTPGTYTNVPLTGGSGSGCTAASVVVAGGVVTSVVLSVPGCGTNYLGGDTLSAATANLGGTGTGGLVLTVQTLSGGAVIDAIGNQFVKWDNVTVEGDCTNTPNAGIAVGRYNGNGASDQQFESVNVLQCFKFTSFYNLAAENLYLNSPMLYNRNPSTTVPFYALVQDGGNHFNWSSTFKTFSGEPIDTQFSFNSSLFTNGSFLTTIGSAGTPIYTNGAHGHRYYDSYVAGIGACGIELNTPVSGNRQWQLTFDVHVESSAMTNIFCITGQNTQVLADIEYNELSLQNISGVIFSPAANVTSVLMNGLKVQVNFAANANTKIFGNPTIWTVSPVRIQLPNATNYTAPLAMNPGGWLCFNNFTASICTSTGIPLTTVYGQGNFTHTFNAGTGTVRLIGCGAGGGGGSGAKQNNTLLASGGAGGGGGACFDKQFKVSELGGTSIRLQIGQGGSGGTQPGAGPVAGVAGNPGTLSTCISSAANCTGTLYMVGGFGGGGAGGQLAAASGSGAGGCLFLNASASQGANQPNGGNGVTTTAGAACILGQAGATTNAPANTASYQYGSEGGAGGGGISGGIGGVGANQAFGATGGGAGGGITAGSGSNNGGNGGASLENPNSTGGSSGTPTGGTATARAVCFGTTGGAGGWGNNAVGASGDGGPGLQGSGGGGGGATQTGGTAGLGGAGGDGFVCVMETL